MITHRRLGLKRGDLKDPLVERPSFDDDYCVLVEEPSSRKRTLSMTAKVKRPKIAIGKGLPALLREKDEQLHVGKASRKNQNLWIDKYQPTSRAELAVNTKKLNEVEAWMKGLQNGTTRRILVLTGASGVGKSTSVRVLARELGIDVVDLESPSSSTYDPDGGNSSYESTSSLFEHFLCASKYSPTCFEDVSVSRMTPVTGCSLALVEEIPAFCLRNPEKLHFLLRRFCVPGRSGLVFVVTENNAGNSHFWTLFPPSVVSQLGLSVIKFNPIVVSTLRKKFLAVAKKEQQTGSRRSAPSPEEIEALATLCRGDIRAGLTALEFSVESDGQTKRKGSDRFGFGNCDHDQSLLLFRAIGRVFYVKRHKVESINRMGLPDHLISEARRPLTYVPEEIMEKCTTSEENYIAFIHENYPHFVPELDLLARAADSFSFTDHLISDWTSRDRLKACAGSVTVRGLMHLQPAEGDNKFHNLNKPFATDVWKKIQDRKAQGHSLIMDLKASVRTSMHFAEIFPYWGKILHFRGISGGSGFLREISVFPTATCRREALMEEEWYASSSDLPTLDVSSQPTTGQSAMENEISELDLQFADIFAEDEPEFSDQGGRMNLESENLFDISQIQIEEFDD